MTDPATNPNPGCTPPPPPSPQADRDAADLPANLAKVLHVVQILLSYGRHLAASFERRANAPGFHIIARAFGTSNAAVILAHIRRGILRAAALQHVLLRRAGSGRDLIIPPLRIRHKAAPPAADTPPAAEPGAARRARRRHPRPSWRDDWLDGAADPLDPRHQPNFADLLAEVRRRPIGRTLGDICADLGIAPGLCLASFWNDLFSTVLHYDGSPAVYEIRRWRREQAFAEEQDCKPTLDQSWPPLDAGGGRAYVVKAVGFFIGEAPVEPTVYGPAADAAYAQRASAGVPGTPAPSAARTWRELLAAPASCDVTAAPASCDVTAAPASCDVTAAPEATGPP